MNGASCVGLAWQSKLSFDFASTSAVLGLNFGAYIFLQIRNMNIATCIIHCTFSKLLNKKCWINSARWAIANHNHSLYKKIRHSMHKYPLWHFVNFNQLKDNVLNKNVECLTNRIINKMRTVAYEEAPFELSGCKCALELHAPECNRIFCTLVKTNSSHL